MPENIVSVKASEQYVKDYKEYALYVERHRTTPEFRDGLKPVQRRILYTAKFISKADDRNRKSADIIGSTMGHYHPHGDSSIQGALYTLVNWYQTKVPLFKGQGNFGNTYQNVPAAARYTEVRLSKFAQECIIDELVSSKEIVDWEPNYDNSRKEPSFLPCKVPLLLINGCTGISVGDKVDVPSHNINEVIDVTIALIKNPKARFTLIPDHCQACEIVDTKWSEINSKGFGNYKVRGVIDIEPYKGVEKKYKDCMTLVIKSCPNLTFLETVINKLEDMIKTNKIIGIVDMEEQSDLNNMRYVIVLKPGTDPNYIRNEIYRNTNMMQTARVNLKVLDINDKDNPAKRLSYRGYLQAWIDFRKLTKLRYYEHRLQKLMTRLHVVEMYVMAMEKGISEDIINIIKKAKTIDDNALIETLIKKCKLTDIQAKFFINCELKKLSMGYYNGFKQEQAKLKKDVKECSDIVLTDGAIEQIIIDELTDIKAKFGEPRKCKLISESEVNGVAAGMFKIVLTENNFIKKIGIDDNIIKPKNDNVKFVINGDNSKDLLLFDEFGKVFDIPINKIPFADKNSNGIDIRLINKYINSNITTVIYQPIMEQYNKGFIVTLTKDGFVKRMTTTDFLSVPASGIVYCKLDGDDRIIDILLFNNNAEIVVYGNKKALRIDINDIPILKRNSRGCISMSSKTTQVEGMSVISKSFKDIVVVTKNGYINKIIPDCVQKGRSKAGSNVIKLGKTDNITSIYGVNPTDTLIVTLAPTGEIIEVPVSSIPSGTSISTGTKMIKGGEVVRVYKKGN
jgi:DNA gyrase subunit A